MWDSSQWRTKLSNKEVTWSGSRSWGHYGCCVENRSNGWRVEEGQPFRWFLQWSRWKTIMARLWGISGGGEKQLVSRQNLKVELAGYADVGSVLENVKVCCCHDCSCFAYHVRNNADGYFILFCVSFVCVCVCVHVSVCASLYIWVSHLSLVFLASTLLCWRTVLSIAGCLTTSLTFTH